MDESEEGANATIIDASRHKTIQKKKWTRVGQPTITTINSVAVRGQIGLLLRVLLKYGFLHDFPSR